ncbi:sodium-coupled neutral amino acid symporter 2 [Maylandia zebra]|uniref:sodium-coupled neutral amino acid symporter 2 n=1 Tax=Maylandia zebra TaxID=106582 RepID=UPI00403CBF88
MRYIGVMSSYLYIIRTTHRYKSIHRSQCQTMVHHGDYLVLLVSLCIILPLTLRRDLGCLGYTSGLPLLCMVFFLIVVIIKKFQIPCPLPDIHNDNSTHSLNSSHSDNTSDEDTCRPKYFVINSQIRTTVNHLLCPSKGFSWVRHTTITVFLLAGTNALVIFVPTIFRLIDISAAAMLIFILPSAFYIRLVKKESMKSGQKIGACLFLLICITVMSSSMILIILDWIKNATSEVSPETVFSLYNLLKVCAATTLLL